MSWISTTNIEETYILAFMQAISAKEDENSFE